MMSRIGRAKLFHSSSPNDKSRLIRTLQLDRRNWDPYEDVDVTFARFNQYNDKTLEHKCLVTLANLIEQQSSTLEAGLQAVDSLTVSSDCKSNLRELVSIILEQ